MTSAEARDKFLRGLRERGIRDEKVLEAFARVPREEFVGIQQEPFAFADQALPIECGQTISQPYMVAAMTEALELKPDHKVLEIGTGSGYQAAILACLAREVISIERHKALSDLARSRLERLGFGNVTVIHADGTEGAAGYAPFDRIVVTAAAGTIPPDLVSQLAAEGVLIAPIGRPHDVQTLIRFRKGRDGGLQDEHLMPVRFVPLLPGVP